MRYILTGLATLLLFILGCKEKSIQSQWATHVPVIDGHLDDWEPASYLHVDKGTIIGVRNDSEFLYLAARLPGQSQMRFAPNLTLWLDPAAHKNKDWAAYFPAAMHADFNRYRGGFWQSLTPEEQDRISARLDTLGKGVLIVNEKANFRRLYLAGDTDAFSVAFGQAADSLTLEAKIPLTFDSFYQKINVSQGQRNLGLGFSTGTRPARVMRPPAARMEPGARGGPVPPVGTEPPMRREIKKPTEIWLEVNLANEK